MEIFTFNTTEITFYLSNEGTLQSELQSFLLLFSDNEMSTIDGVFYLM